jgi:hypothetical protein
MGQSTGSEEEKQKEFLTPAHIKESRETKYKAKECHLLAKNKELMWSTIKKCVEGQILL